MYKAILSGSAKNVRFDAGQKLDYPKDYFKGCKSVIWIEEEKAKVEVKTEAKKANKKK